MSKLIAVEGMVVEPQEATVTAAITPTTAASSKLTGSDKGVYTGTVTCSITGATDSATGAVQSAPAVCQLDSTSVKCTSQDEKLLREGDTGSTVVVTAQIPGSPPVPATINVTPEVISAGQTKAFAK